MFIEKVGRIAGPSRPIFLVLQVIVWWLRPRAHLCRLTSVTVSVPSTRSYCVSKQWANLRQERMRVLQQLLRREGELMYVHYREKSTLHTVHMNMIEYKCRRLENLGQYQDVILLFWEIRKLTERHLNDELNLLSLKGFVYALVSKDSSDFVPSPDLQLVEAKWWLINQNPK